MRALASSALAAVLAATAITVASSIATADAGVPAATVAQAGTVAHFTSPSGNIDCLLSNDDTYGRGVACVVEQNDWWPLPPERPSSCDLDWVGTELYLTQKGKVFVGACRGDVGPVCTGNCVTLPFGESVRVGKIRCSSAKSGITCQTTNGARHGFRVSRSAYYVY